MGETMLQNNPSWYVNNNITQSMSASLNNMGYVYKLQAKIPEALECYFKSLKIQETVDYKLG